MKRTTTEAELRSLVAQGWTQVRIAELLGTKQTYVSAAFILLGITPANPPTRNVAPPIGEYLADLSSGMTLREIGERHGKSHASVYRAMKRAGLPTCARQILRHEAEQKAAPVAVVRG